MMSDEISVLTAKEMADTLLKLHFENLAYARHHETMRSTASNLLAWISEGANKSWCSPTGARPVRVRP